MDTDEPGLDTLMDDEDYQAQQPGSGFGPDHGAGLDTGGSGDIEDPGPEGDKTTPGELITLVLYIHIIIFPRFPSVSKYVYHSFSCCNCWT